MCDDSDVFIPNAFTPNGDGNNDVWRVRSNFIDELSLVVYDRWGEEIFTTTDPTQGWDGTFEGDLMSPDVYGYTMTVRCINNETFSKQGNVSLLK